MLDLSGGPVSASASPFWPRTDEEKEEIVNYLKNVSLIKQYSKNISMFLKSHGCSPISQYQTCLILSRLVILQSFRKLSRSVNPAL